MGDRLSSGDTSALDWQRQAPHPQRAHPTIEHLTPLFGDVGAGGEGSAVRTLHQSHEFGSLALEAFAWD